MDVHLRPIQYRSFMHNKIKHACIIIVCMNTGDLQIQCNIYTFFKQISFLRFKILYKYK